MRREINDVFLEAMRGDDFIGVQTYSRQRFGPAGPLRPEDGVELTQMGYEFWPESLEATIRYAAAATGLPIIVTENCIGTTDDVRREVRRLIQILGKGGRFVFCTTHYLMDDVPIENALAMDEEARSYRP